MEEVEDDAKLMGCAPYLQIFKGGKLLFTAAASLHVQQPDEELPFVQVVDGTVPFHIEQVIQGDILIRCRHLTFNKQRVSMFRAAFHTGYSPANVLRLTKSQLDGACADKRFPNDFFLDLIFEKVDAEMASKHLEEQVDDNDERKSSPMKNKGPVVKASNYDGMLQGDSRFWKVISDRREEHSSRRTTDPNWGPTVGRRRGDGNKKKNEEVPMAATPTEGSMFETFSIGNEFDFLPDGLSAKVDEEPVPKDALMEALGALDEDVVGTEEVVFDAMEATPSSSQGRDSASSSVIDMSGDVVAGTEAPNESASLKDRPDSVGSPGQPLSTDDGLDDMDALLAAADEDLGEMNLDDFEDDGDDDGDLDDLEAMLSSTA